MDYRAAATRQLKDSNANSNSAASTTAAPSQQQQRSKIIKVNSTSASASASGRSTPVPAANASSLSVAAGDSSKMKGNSGAWSPANSSIKKSAAPAAAAAGSAGAPLSYAATAAAKKALINAGSATSSSSSAVAAATSASSAEKSIGRRSGSSGRAVPAQSLSSLINAQVRVTLVNNATIEGSVFTYDVYSGVIALVSDSSVSNGANGPTDQQQQQQQQSSNNSPSVGGGIAKQQIARIHLVKAANIKDLQVTAKSGTLMLPEVHPVATATIEARKKSSLMQEQERASRIGIGVTDVAQSIFEALSRTLPCRWDQSKIVVLDEVIIESPYSVDNCREISQAPVTLQRVKKVLQGELNRIATAAACN
ncbi:hypothetical protein J3B02_003992 [Coemansia erecta]|nr:hypothetical protein J3B02_003992 [Coemansia erecta]